MFTWKTAWNLLPLICFTVSSPCGIDICVTWSIMEDTLIILCKIATLRHSVRIIDPSNKVAASCISPVPASSCTTSFRNGNVSQNASTKLTVFEVRGILGQRIEGKWICEHGHNLENGTAEIPPLKQKGIMMQDLDAKYGCDLKLLLWCSIGFILVTPFVIVLDIMIVCLYSKLHNKENNDTDNSNEQGEPMHDRYVERNENNDTDNSNEQGEPMHDRYVERNDIEEGAQNTNGQQEPETTCISRYSKHVREKISEVCRCGILFFTYSFLYSKVEYKQLSIGLTVTVLISFCLMFTLPIVAGKSMRECQYEEAFVIVGIILGLPIPVWLVHKGVKVKQLFDKTKCDAEEKMLGNQDSSDVNQRVFR